MTEGPTRHARDIETTAALAEELPAMMELARHNRGRGTTGDAGSERKLVTALNVEVWEEADGSESIVLNGTITGTLEAKGVLHDALWALVHESSTA